MAGRCRIQHDRAAVLQEWAETLALHGPFVNARIQQNGIRVRAVEPANVRMVDAWLSGTDLDTYDAETGRFALNAKQLAGALDELDKTDSVTITLDENGVDVQQVDHDEIYPADEDEIRNEPDLPDLEWSGSISTDAKQVYRTLYLLNNNTSIQHVFLATPDGEFTMLADDDIGAVKSTPDATVHDPVDGHGSLFSIDYFEEVLKVMQNKGGRNLHIKLDDEFPVVYGFDLDQTENSHIDVWIAPRIQNTEDRLNFGQDSLDPDITLSTTSRRMRRVFEPLSATGDEARLYFDSDRLFTRVVDPANVAATTTVAHAGMFDTYDAEQTVVGLNTAEIDKLLLRFYVNEEVTITYDGDTRMLEASNGWLTRRVGTIDPDAIRKPPRLTDTPYTSEATVDADEFYDAIPNKTEITRRTSPPLSLGVTDETLWTVGLYDHGEGDKQDPTEVAQLLDAETRGRSFNVLSLDYIYKITGRGNLDTDFTIRTAWDYPLQVAYSRYDGDLDVRYVVSPKSKIDLGDKLDSHRGVLSDAGLDVSALTVEAIEDYDQLGTLDDPLPEELPDPDEWRGIEPEPEPEPEPEQESSTMPPTDPDPAPEGIDGWELYDDQPDQVIYRRPDAGESQNAEAEYWNLFVAQAPEDGSWEVNSSLYDADESFIGYHQKGVGVNLRDRDEALQRAGLYMNENPVPDEPEADDTPDVPVSKSVGPFDYHEGPPGGHKWATTTGDHAVVEVDQGPSFWSVTLTVDGEVYDQGSYNTEEQAVEEAEQLMDNFDALTNDPDQGKTLDAATALRHLRQLPSDFPLWDETPEDNDEDEYRFHQPSRRHHIQLLVKERDDGWEFRRFTRGGYRGGVSHRIKGLTFEEAGEIVTGIQKGDDNPETVTKEYAMDGYETHPTYGSDEDEPYEHHSERWEPDVDSTDTPGGWGIDGDLTDEEPLYFRQIEEPRHADQYISVDPLPAGTWRTRYHHADGFATYAPTEGYETKKDAIRAARRIMANYPEGANTNELPKLMGKLANASARFEEAREKGEYRAMRQQQVIDARQHMPQAAGVPPDVAEGLAKRHGDLSTIREVAREDPETLREQKGIGPARVRDIARMELPEDADTSDGEDQDLREDLLEAGLTGPQATALVGQFGTRRELSRAVGSNTNAVLDVDGVGERTLEKLKRLFGIPTKAERVEHRQQAREERRQERAEQQRQERNRKRAERDVLAATSGIPDAVAERVIEKYGTASKAAAQAHVNPETVEEIKGIGPARREKIADALAELSPELHAGITGGTTDTEGVVAFVVDETGISPERVETLVRRIDAVQNRAGRGDAEAALAKLQQIAQTDPGRLARIENIGYGTIERLGGDRPTLSEDPPETLEEAGFDTGDTEPDGWELVSEANTRVIWRGPDTHPTRRGWRRYVEVRKEHQKWWIVETYHDSEKHSRTDPWTLVESVDSRDEAIETARSYMAEKKQEPRSSAQWDHQRALRVRQFAERTGIPEDVASRAFTAFGTSKGGTPHGRWDKAEAAIYSATSIPHDDKYEKLLNVRGIGPARAKQIRQAAVEDAEPIPEEGDDRELLMQVEGIGETRADVLLGEYGDLGGVKEAAATETYTLSQLPSIPKQTALQLYKRMEAAGFDMPPTLYDRAKAEYEAETGSEATPEPDTAEKTPTHTTPPMSTSKRQLAKRYVERMNGYRFDEEESTFEEEILYRPTGGGRTIRVGRLMDDSWSVYHGRKKGNFASLEDALELAVEEADNDTSPEDARETARQVKETVRSSSMSAEIKGPEDLTEEDIEAIQDGEYPEFVHAIISKAWQGYKIGVGKYGEDGDESELGRAQEYAGVINSVRDVFGRPPETFTKLQEYGVSPHNVRAPEGARTVAQRAGLLGVASGGRASSGGGGAEETGTSASTNGSMNGNEPYDPTTEFLIDLDRVRQRRGRSEAAREQAQQRERDEQGRFVGEGGSSPLSGLREALGAEEMREQRERERRQEAAERVGTPEWEQRREEAYEERMEERRRERRLEEARERYGDEWSDEELIEAIEREENRTVVSPMFPLTGDLRERELRKKAERERRQRERNRALFTRTTGPGNVPDRRSAGTDPDQTTLDDQPPWSHEQEQRWEAAYENREQRAKQQKQQERDEVLAEFDWLAGLSDDQGRVRNRYGQFMDD